MVILNVTRNQGFTLSLEDTFFEKPQVRPIDLPAVLGLTLKQIFWKTKTFIQKLEYRFLVDSIKIENASFPYKTAILESNVKTKRMVSTQWTYHKERSFTSNYFISLEIFFQFKNLL